ncbi:MAG: insulinase family protein, partial [Myxococcales bacterium]|nr:insulinase family protein [Myxococcales bacterium]
MLETPHVQTAPNGLTVVLLPRDSGQTALIALDVGVGSRHESVQDSGLSHVLEHLVFHGSPSHPTVAEVDAAAEAMGAAFDASTGRASTRLEHWMDPRHLQTSAELLAELVRAPRFTGLDTERAVILEEALDEYDEKGRLVDCEALARRALWPDHGLGRSIIGFLPNIERFTLEDLRRHHETYYRAGNMVLTVAGPLPLETLAKAAEPFMALPAGEVPATAPAPPPPDRPQFILVDDGRSQCDCRMAWWAPGGHDPDAPAFELLMRALDDGLASR